MPAADNAALGEGAGRRRRGSARRSREGKEHPFRPAAVNCCRSAIAHEDRGEDSMALKLVTTLLGNIDVPGGHLGVPLDLRGFFIEPGEHGMLKRTPTSCTRRCRSSSRRTASR